MCLTKTTKKCDLEKYVLFAGVIDCIPISIVLFLGIEALPLLTEESKDFVKDGPKSIVLAMAVTSIAYWLALVLYPATAPGAYALMESTYQSLDSFAAVYSISPDSVGYKVLVLFLTVIPVCLLLPFIEIVFNEGI